MLKQGLVIAGGFALAISFPLVALAVTTDRTPPLDDVASVIVDEASQPMVQQRLRVHAETGPPEGFEPQRQRLHQSENAANGQQHTMRPQRSEARAGDAGDCSNACEPNRTAHGRSGGAHGNGRSGGGNG